MNLRRQRHNASRGCQRTACWGKYLVLWKRKWGENSILRIFTVYSILPRMASLLKELRNAYKVSKRRPEEKKSLWRQKHSWISTAKTKVLEYQRLLWIGVKVVLNYETVEQIGTFKYLGYSKKVISLVVLIRHLIAFYIPFLGLGPFFSSLILYTVGLTGRGNSPSQDLCLHREHKHRINAHNTDIHALSGIRTHDPSVLASEATSWLRPRGHCDRLSTYMLHKKKTHRRMTMKETFRVS
jgi:hypothetical protein